MQLLKHDSLVQSLRLHQMPGTGSWWIGLAISYESLGNRPDALSAFQRALRTESLKIPLARYARRRTAELQAND